jgi:hypothetical protein
VTTSIYFRSPSKQIVTIHAITRNSKTINKIISRKPALKSSSMEMISKTQSSTTKVMNERNFFPIATVIISSIMLLKNEQTIIYAIRFTVNSRTEKGKAESSSRHA